MRDTLIVGGGIIGLSVAYELVRRGQGVTLLERASQPAQGATHVAAGMLAAVSETERTSPQLAVFGQDSLERFPLFVRELETLSDTLCQYREEGTLWVAFSRDEAAALERAHKAWRQREAYVTNLSASEVLSREPHLSSKIHSGLWVASDHQVDPRCLAHSLVAAFRRLGGKIVCDSRVCEVVVEDDRVCGVLAEMSGGHTELIASDTVVLAAGAWSCVSIDSPLRDLGVRPVKGQLVRLRGPGLLRHIVRTPDIYLIPRIDGELLVGGTVEEQGFSTAPTAGAIMDLMRHAWRALPGMYDLEFVECSVGVRPAVSDHLPVIGAGPAAGLFVATAHYRDGILLAPATAHYLADLIMSGEMPDALAPFAPARLLPTDRDDRSREQVWQPHPDA